ncbi:LOW QUALITY PROTEIN: zinc finger C2HC domain-containing protein 1C [Anopheles marshallii]|uniref:LOW QUALITY PROTEIN: zinc finger C2HC domain-containing protein 1C n=1 Tax=Anopheles marshallii TaxID=1521116 RepID=UPI00237BFBDD|nr:LOW QUALITY PROTEIN: zinc finger C2HC domain-containing protein 1C [Anopheles marshallii]
MYLAGKRTRPHVVRSLKHTAHKSHRVIPAQVNMKLKSLDYGDIIESFTNRYENIVKKMRFQQRQQQERDQRKIEQIATRTTATTGTVAIASSQGGRTATTTSTTSSSAVSATVELSERLNATSLSSTLGAGKVRQMFDERRHRVAGIDKSYPLQPIQTTSTVPTVAHGNHAVSGNGTSNSTGHDGGGASLARGMAKTGLNNKPRVPPISASSRTRLMQHQSQARGTNLRQDSLVAMQTTRSNGGDPGTLMMDPNGAYDDNDNFLELEKFPDAASIDEDALDAADRLNAINGNGAPAKVGKSNGSSTKIAPSSSVQKPLKKSPIASSNSVATRSPNGSAKPGVATPRSVKSNGPSRTVTQPSPSGSASSVRRPSSVANGNMLAPSSEPVPDGLTRCDICSRNFATDRIDKHRQICQKTKTKKRKIFDITKHRVQGTDAESFVLRGKKSTSTGAATVSRKPSSQLSTATGGAGGKPSNWRKKHEEFIATIRAAKEMKAHLARGGKLSDLPPPPPSENPDYVQCPHCMRRFNQTAADRHIPKCATMLHNKPKPKPKASTTMRKY